MTKKHSHLRKTCELIDYLLDGEISDEQRLELEKLVCESSECRQLYIRLIHQQAFLRPALGAASMADRLALTNDYSELDLSVDPEEIREMLDEEAIVADRKEGTEQTRIEIIAAENISAFRREREDDRLHRPKPLAARRNVFFPIVASLAAAILLIVWMLPNPEPMVSAPVLVASIEGSTDASWRDPSLSAAPGTQLFTQRTLVLTRGIVEIAFEGGAKVIVEAPATFELLSEDSARLLLGKLVGRVPNSEMQLTINTPQASIVDMGTEFGVEVDRQQVTHLHVFEGRVSVVTLDAKGKSAQQRTVLVNEAVYLRPKTGAIEPAPAVVASRFVRRVSIPTSSVRFYTNEQEWLAAVHDVERFSLTVDTLPMAEEVKSSPKVNQNLGPQLTFSSATTSLARSFQVLMREPGKGPRHGFVFSDTGDPKGIDKFAGVISIGGADQFEDDDFEVRLLGDGPPVTAMAVVIRQNDSIDHERLSVFNAAGSLMGQLQQIPSMDDQEETFLGLVSNVPIGHVVFDEDDGWDDVALSGVILASGSESEPSNDK